MEFSVNRLLKRNEFVIDIPITDLCNLNCAGCLSFSSLSKRANNIDISETTESIKTLLDKGIKPCMITLSGGEPLLYPNLKDLIHGIRKHYDGCLNIITNGILLEKRLDDIIEADEVTLSMYQGINYNRQILLLKEIKKQICIHPRTKDHFINLGLSEIKNTDEKTTEIFENKCFLNCLSLKDNRLYSCRVTSNIHVLNEYFNTNFKISNSDYLDIDEITSKDEIFEFTKNKHEFCKYCNFNSKLKFAKSKRLASEWIFKS